MNEEIITNEQGQVLLVWTLGERRTPKPVVIDGTNRTYIFSYNCGVCATWVEPQDVARLLSHKEKTCNCNSGTYVNAFAYPTLVNANMWRYGNRDGVPT